MEKKATEEKRTRMLRKEYATYKNRKNVGGKWYKEMRGLLPLMGRPVDTPLRGIDPDTKQFIVGIVLEGGTSMSDEPRWCAIVRYTSNGHTRDTTISVNAIKRPTPNN